MGRLTYSMSVSLDGFAEGPGASLDWVHVDEPLHEAFNEEAREAGTFLYGRRMYELMAAYWPTALDDPAATPAMRDFAVIWRDTPKVVFSRSLRSVAHNSRLVHDDAVGTVRAMKAEAANDLQVGGPALAGSLLRAGLVDEVRLFLNPVILGAGTPFFPPLDAPVRLRHVESRSFGGGVVLVRYEVETAR